MDERELTILLVEDDKNACRDIQNYADTIEEVRITGVTNNSSEALKLTQHMLPDVVIPVSYTHLTLSTIGG